LFVCDKKKKKKKLVSLFVTSERWISTNVTKKKAAKFVYLYMYIGEKHECVNAVSNNMHNGEKHECVNAVSNMHNRWTLIKSIEICCEQHFVELLLLLGLITGVNCTMNK